jgi:hypothetical protein
MSAHRQRADEAYQVGAGLTPVAAYLAQDDIIRIALEHGVDMIHPGYGFLSENATFARKVEEAGIAFIGPTPEVIDGLGDKTKARTIGRKASVLGTALLINPYMRFDSCRSGSSSCTRHPRPGRILHRWSFIRQGARLPGNHQGRYGRRRSRNACRSQPGRVQGFV